MSVETMEVSQENDSVSSLWWNFNLFNVIFGNLQVQFVSEKWKGKNWKMAENFLSPTTSHTKNAKWWNGKNKN